MSVWNPWHGCTRLSSGCRGCVVFRVDAAHGRNTELVRKTRAFDLPVRKDRNREYKLRPEDGPVETCCTSDFFHPEMPPAKRAKLFAPFDALRGFDFAILMKNEIYTDRVIMSPEDREELDRRLSILHDLTYNSRIARANRPQVAVTYYEPCSDVNSEAYASQGQYRTVTGICRNVDAEVTKTILVSVARAPRPQAPRAPRTEIDVMRIPMEDILKIESPGDIFRKDLEEL